MSDVQEEAVRRVKCALAEMGYGDADVRTRLDNGDVEIHPSVPDSVAWMALRLIDQMDACWSCWWSPSGDYDRSRACSAGNCTARPDDPKTPPRELLRSAS